MTYASYRRIFLETLAELCDLTRNGGVECDVRWSADYIARHSKWYRFRGEGGSGEMTSEGRELDVCSGRVRRLPPSLLTFVMLEFESNGLIAAYTGAPLPSAIIAESLLGRDDTPEIVSVSIRKRSVEDGLLRSVATSFVFVGFENTADAEQPKLMIPLAKTPEIVSPIWFRDRTTLLELASVSA